MKSPITIWRIACDIIILTERHKRRATAHDIGGTSFGISANIAAQAFTFRELAAATDNFQPECLLGEGGFGRVYKGGLENNRRVTIFDTYKII